MCGGGDAGKGTKKKKKKIMKSATANPPARETAILRRSAYG